PRRPPDASLSPLSLHDALPISAALREMVGPGLLAVAAPVTVGWLLGVDALGGLLAGTTVSGALLALFMANAGGAWDNAKKYIEADRKSTRLNSSHVKISYAVFC